VNKMDVRQLVEAAACKVGSDYRLSQELGVSRSLVSEWKAGKRPCPVPQQAAMADIAGIDVERVIAEAIIEQTRGTARGERLARALGARLGKALSAWAAGVLAMLAISGAGEPAHAAGGPRLIGDNVSYVKYYPKPTTRASAFIARH
jgi:DNA-binding transcriptional regulator YdaS (Cro superfamily)